MLNPNLNPNRCRHPERRFVIHEGIELSKAEQMEFVHQIMLFGSLYLEIISKSKKEASL